MSYRRFLTLSCTAAALATVSMPAATAVPAAGSAASPVVVDCGQKGQVRPQTFILTCGDANDGLAGLRWSSWGGGSASGTGQEDLNDCVPSCAEGHFHSYGVRIRLDGAAPWPGHPGLRHYTLLHLTYVSTRPPGTAREVTYTLWS